MDWTHAATGGVSLGVGVLVKLAHGWLRGQQYGVSRKVARESEEAAKEREEALEQRLGTVFQAGLQDLRSSFRADLAEAENRIFERINGKYLQSNLAAAKFGEYDRRIERLEEGQEEMNKQVRRHAAGR